MRKALLILILGWCSVTATCLDGLVQNTWPFSLNSHQQVISKATHYNVTNGNTLLLLETAEVMTSPTITSSPSLTWTLLKTQDSANSMVARVWCASINFTGALTVTSTTSDAYGAIVPYLSPIEYRGLNGCTTDGTAQGAQAANNSTVTTGAIVTANANDVLICLVGANAPGTNHVFSTSNPFGAGWQIRQQDNGQADIFGWASKRVSATGSYTCSPTIDASMPELVAVEVALQVGSNTSTTPCLSTLIVAKGDSLTNGPTANGTPEQGFGDQRYPDNAAISLTGPIYLVNLGQGNETMAQMVTAAATEIDPLIDSANRSADIASIQGFINDVNGGQTDCTTLVNSGLSWITGRIAVGWKVIYNTVTSTSVIGSTLRACLNSTMKSHALAVCTASGCTGQGGDTAFVVAAPDVDANIGCDSCYTNLTYFLTNNDTHMTAAGYALWSPSYLNAINYLLSMNSAMSGTATVSGSGAIK